MVLGGGGISKYNQQLFSHIPLNEGHSKNYITCIAEDKARNFWFGTWGGGISKYNNHTFTHFTEKEGLISNSV